jgi:hypothetical protein
MRAPDGTVTPDHLPDGFRGARLPREYPANP